MKLYFRMLGTLHVHFSASAHSCQRVNFSGHGKDQSEMERDTPTGLGQVLGTPDGEGSKAGPVGTIQ